MVKPVGDYILVRVIKDDNNGLIISGKSESQKGEVIDVGPGMLQYTIRAATSFPIRTEMFIKPKQIVIWQKFADADYTYDENKETYALVKIQQVMGVENE